MAYQSFVDLAQAALPRIPGPGVEGMGDFASGTSASKLWSPRGMLKGLGTGARGVGRMAMGPIPLAVGALQPLASATAKRQVQSGQYTEPGVYKATPGVFPNNAIDTRGISNTNPYTGTLETNYANVVQPDRLWNPSAPKAAIAPVGKSQALADKVVPEGGSVNSISPLDPYGSMIVDGNRINYGDIGNPLKDAALINSKGYSFGVAPAEATTTQNVGGTGLNDLLKSIQSVTPVQDYASRVGALSMGNTTWDMDPIAKVMAAKAGHQADMERYQQQTGALANLGSAQMNANATMAGHQATLQGKREETAAMAPYYAGQTQKNVAQAEAAPLAAKADVLKALTEQAKNNPVLKTTLDIMAGLAERGDVVGYNAYAAKVAALTGKLIPPMQAQD